MRLNDAYSFSRVIRSPAMPRKTRRPFGRLDDPIMRSFVGASLLHRLEDADDDHVPLRIGNQRWTTHQLAVEVGVVHTKAARLLTKAAAEIGARSVLDLYKRSSPYTFCGIRNLGETAIYVLWRLFESQGLDPDEWATAGDREAAIVSFRSLKLRELAADARSTADERKRARRQSRETHEAGVRAALKGTP